MSELKTNPGQVQLTIFVPSEVKRRLTELHSRCRASRGDIFSAALLHFSDLSPEDRERLMVSVTAIRDTEKPGGRRDKRIDN